MKRKFCIVVESDDIKGIDRIAKAMERPRSYIIRKVISDFLKLKKETKKEGENGDKK